LARITIQHTLIPETSNRGWVKIKIEKRIICEEERFLTFPILIFQEQLFTQTKIASNLHLNAQYCQLTIQKTSYLNTTPKFCPYQIKNIAIIEDKN
jgi:hypothetical protein